MTPSTQNIQIDRSIETESQGAGGRRSRWERQLLGMGFQVRVMEMS